MDLLNYFFPSENLPSSLPKGWPNPSQESLQLCPNRVITVGIPQAFMFKSNIINTTKYTYINFLPLFLFDEFNPKTKIANCYFLLISGLQCINNISNTGGFPTTLLPLLFIIFIDGIFSFYYDYLRRKNNYIENNSFTRRLNRFTKCFEECIWSEIEVGDIIRIYNREIVPADVLILRVHEKLEQPAGICYIDTMSLDGETSLKIRHALSSTYNIIRNESDLMNIKGKIITEHPNKLINTFEGFCRLGFASTLDKDNDTQITSSNILLRSCILRNSEWVDAVVINTGHDTKVYMNSMRIKEKISHFQTATADRVKAIMIFLIFLCLLSSSLQLIFYSSYHLNEAYYLKWDPNLSSLFFVDIFYYFLLHSTLIPVSLYVTLSLTRFLQTFIMENDLDMYAEEIDKKMMVKNMNLNEELGQVTHIFTDKTGTLTCNRMDFRKVIINGKLYGEGISEIGRSVLLSQGKVPSADTLEKERLAQSCEIPHVAFYSPDFQKDLNGKNGKKQSKMIEMMGLALATCNDCIVDILDSTYLTEPSSNDSVSGSVNSDTNKKRNDKNNNIIKDNNDKPLNNKFNLRYSASSPDDEAVCYAGAFMGYRLESRILETLLIYHEKTRRTEKYKVLYNVPFSSYRKRMSVVIRAPNSKIYIITKGADTTMIPRLSDESKNSDEFKKTQEDVELLLLEGLRCLYIAYTEVDEEDYIAWENEVNILKKKQNENLGLHRTANTEETELEALEAMLENELTLLGVIALEDKLQDGVRHCLNTFRNIGISTWMLTGDKPEASWSIGLACGLVDPPRTIQVLKKKKKNKKKNKKLTKKRKSIDYDDDDDDNYDDDNLNIDLDDDDDDIENYNNNNNDDYDIVNEGGTLKVSITSNEVKSRDDLILRLNEELRKVENDLDLDENEGTPLPLRALVIDGFTLSLLIAEETVNQNDIDIIRPTKIKLKNNKKNKKTQRRKIKQKIRNELRDNDSDYDSEEDLDDDEDLPLIYLFFTLVQYCQTCLACRVSPDQKRQLVSLYKSYFSTDISDSDTDYNNLKKGFHTAFHNFLILFNPFTLFFKPKKIEDDIFDGLDANKRSHVCLLAIGDGANDVSMIQEAHIGIGIHGDKYDSNHEGTHASINSDYSIPNFKSILPLLLHHGRLNYKRQSNIVYYNLYKNLLLCLTQFWFHFNCAFSGQKWYAEGLMQLFNMFFSSLPIIFYGGYDVDLSKTLVLNQYPQVYQNTMNGDDYSLSNFRYWIFNSIFESLLLGTIVLFCLDTSVIFINDTPHGLLDSFSTTGFICIFIIVIIVNLKVYLILYRVGWWNHFVIIFSIMLFIATSALYGAYNTLDYLFYNSPLVAASSGSAWLFVFLFITMIVAKDCYLKGLERAFAFSPQHIIQEIEIYGTTESRSENEKQNFVVKTITKDEGFKKISPV